MGNTLPEPRTEKHSEEGNFGKKYSYGVADMQGWRLTMEDAYIVADDFDSSSHGEVCFVGVFDGHGGSEVSKFCANQYWKNLKQLPAFESKDFPTAMKECYHLMDTMLQKEEHFPEVVNYRAESIVHRFNLIAEIIIDSKANHFTLTQLQEVLNQANFFNVTLTIKPDLLVSLEKLYQSNDAGNTPSEEKKPEAPTPPQKPDKPKKPTKPKFGGASSNTKKTKKPGFFGSKLRRTKKGAPKSEVIEQNEEPTPSESISNPEAPKLAGEASKEVDTLTAAENDADKKSTSNSSSSVRSTGDSKKGNLIIDSQRALPLTPSVKAEVDAFKPVGMRGGSERTMSDFALRGTKPLPPETPAGVVPPHQLQIDMPPPISSRLQDEDDHDPFAEENALDALSSPSRSMTELPTTVESDMNLSSVEGNSVSELEIEDEDETLPPELVVSNIRSSMQLNKSKSMVGSKDSTFGNFSGLLDDDESGSFEGIGGDDPSLSAIERRPPGLTKAQKKVKRRTLKKVVKRRTRVKRHKSKRIGEDGKDESDFESDSDDNAAEHAKIGKSNGSSSASLMSNASKSPKKSIWQRQKSGETKISEPPPIESVKSKRKKSSAIQNSKQSEGKTEPAKKSEKEKKKTTDNKETTSSEVNEKKESGEKEKTADAKDDATKKSPATGLNMEPYAVQKKNAANTNIEELPKFITAAGCTAISALFHNNTIYVANVGDSRAVISRHGQAVPLSVDHKPSLKGEEDRIRAAGGTINAQGRINGDLNLSRCVGDLRFKTQKDLLPSQQIVTAEADITRHEIKKTDQFLVLACDGVWDVMSNQQVVYFVLDQIHSGETSVKKIAENLLDKCLSPNLQETRGLGGDNMTCIIVLLQPIDMLQSFKPDSQGSVTNIFRRIVSSKARPKNRP